jgi:hypothetical protein
LVRRRSGYQNERKATVKRKIFDAGCIRKKINPREIVLIEVCQVFFQAVRYSAKLSISRFLETGEDSSALPKGEES